MSTIKKKSLSAVVIIHGGHCTAIWLYSSLNYLKNDEFVGAVFYWVVHWTEWKY
jgi:hypothetical protein